MLNEQAELTCYTYWVHSEFYGNVIKCLCKNECWTPNIDHSSTDLKNRFIKLTVEEKKKKGNKSVRWLHNSSIK